MHISGRQQALLLTLSAVPLNPVYIPQYRFKDMLCFGSSGAHPTSTAVKLRKIR